MSDSSESSVEVEVRSGAGVVLRENTRCRDADTSAPPSSKGDGEKGAEQMKELEIKDLEDKSIVTPPRVRKGLEEAKDFGHFSSLRVFRFLHLFSGEKDALGEAIEAEAKKARIRVECVGLDRKTDANVDLNDAEKMGRLKKEVEEDEWDGFHSGFPCGSFSRARWNPGGPPPVRSSKEMYGFADNSARQQEEADRGTLGAVRSSEMMALQCKRADARGIQKVSTLENPPGTEGIEGSAWMLPEIKRDLEAVQAAKADFNTCAFQSEKVRWFKPGRWAGRIGDDDFKDLCKICRCPNWVTHKSLVGKAATEEAGAYPKALVEMIARKIVNNFRKTLDLEWWRYMMATRRAEVTSLQESWIRNMDRKRQTKRPLQSVYDKEEAKLPSSSSKMSRKEFKTVEDAHYVGGMRNPAKSVSRLHGAQVMGSKIREEWENFYEARKTALSEFAQAYGTNEAQFDQYILEEWRERIREVLKCEPEAEGVTIRENFEFKSPLQKDLWSAWINATNDPDTAIKDWLIEGVPLGIAKEIPGSNGIFPPVEKEEQEIDQAQEIAAQLGLENYSSMEEHRGEALLELQRYEEKGIARMVSSEELLQRFPTHGTISRLAMILKQKDDGTVKSRIIMDLRRSGGNSRCKVPERIVLPRVSDVVDSLVWMRDHRGELQGALGQRGYKDMYPGRATLFSVDLEDAFCHWAVCKEELCNTIAPHVDPNRLVVFVALLFGYKSAPLLMGRLSAAIGRLLQALVKPFEMQVQVYIDDILGILAGPRAQRSKLLSMVLYTLGAFGVRVSLKKGEQGPRIKWIGVAFEINYPENVTLGIPQKMVEEISTVLENVQSRGMIGFKELRSLTGRLSWVAGTLPRLRWAVSMCYGTLQAVLKEDPSIEEKRAAERADKRPKKKLIPVKRLGVALPWLRAALSDSRRLMVRRIPLDTSKTRWAITTDASPQGVGGILLGQLGEADSAFTVMDAFESKVTAAEAELLGIDHKEASGQAVLECLAVFRALKLFGYLFPKHRVLIRSDSTVALGMASKLASSTPTINWLAAEIALLLEKNQVLELIPHHIPGKWNVEADWLSRWHERQDRPMPIALKNCEIRNLEPVGASSFALTPPGSRGVDAEHSCAVWAGVR